MTYQIAKNAKITGAGRKSRERESVKKQKLERRPTKEERENGATEPGGRRRTRTRRRRSRSRAGAGGRRRTRTRTSRRRSRSRSRRKEEDQVKEEKQEGAAGAGAGAARAAGAGEAGAGEGAEAGRRRPTEKRVKKAKIRQSTHQWKEEEDIVREEYKDSKRDSPKETPSTCTNTNLRSTPTPIESQRICWERSG
ncbi:hypothetical protein M405DRAFT_915795 [Rhizopogon salebrosus TDB-379]|nr:hypothetical protein M405DRAFT_915795 [Rhizopogon salebrosus TDB-379]